MTSPESRYLTTSFPEYSNIAIAQNDHKPNGIKMIEVLREKNEWKNGMEGTKTLFLIE